MKTQNIVAWVIAGLLAFAFAGSGIMKLTGAEELVGNFERWGYSSGMMYFIGVAEVAGAVGLLLKRLRVLASAGLIVIMAGAVYTHISVGEPFIAPLILAVLCLAVIVLRRTDFQKS